MPNECANCKYAYGPVAAPPDAGQYWCRRFPPKQYHPEWRNCFPLTPAHGAWCGEYKRGSPTPLET